MFWGNDVKATCFTTFPQNRRQKTFDEGGLYVCAGGIDIVNLIKIPLIHSFIVQFGGAWCFVWGDEPTKPRGDGTVSLVGILL